MVKTPLERVENDFYPTAKKLVDALKETVEIDGSVLECCAGDLAISQHFPGCVTNDPYQPDIEHAYRLDASDPFSWSLFPSTDWVVTNPPFKIAPKILPQAMLHARIGVAFLLRLSYMEPCTSGRSDRGDWLIEHSDNMTNLITFCPRPRFRADTNGSDNVTVAWFVWRKDFSWSLLGVNPPFQFVPRWR